MITIIIPVYKNKALFIKNLKNNQPFLNRHQLIVINDNPNENLDQVVKAISPKAIVINNKQNLGFGLSMNKAVKKVKTEIMLFLNSDVKLINNDYEKAIKLFNDQKLFGITLAQIEKDGHLTGANDGHFYQGLFHHRERQSDQVSVNLWPEGGSSLIRCHYFRQLKGFDPDYAPFYWEDVDLGFRAKKMGWYCLYYPLAEVEHHHESTISKYYSTDQIKTISYRNQFLFVWKNFRNLSLISHLFWLPILLVRNRNNKIFKQGLKQAIIRYFQKT